MSDCQHIHDAEGSHVGNVCVPGPFRYQPAFRARGGRKWKPIGEAVDTIEAAFGAVGKILDDDRRGYGQYGKAGIWAVEQGESYYDPHQVFEVSVL